MGEEETGAEHGELDRDEDDKARHQPNGDRASMGPEHRPWRGGELRFGRGRRLERPRDPGRARAGAGRWRRADVPPDGDSVSYFRGPPTPRGSGLPRPPRLKDPSRPWHLSAAARLSAR